MKLTKAQRLFVAIGHVDKEIIRHSCMFKVHPLRHIPTLHSAYNFKKRYLKELRARRKRLIREALEAWKVEERAAHNEGYRDGIYDN